MVDWKNAPDLSTPLDADHLTQAFDDERASERAHQSSTYETVYAVAAPSGDSTGATDRAAIQAKIDVAATAGGGIVVLQPGTYLTEYHLLMKTGVRLVGAGMFITTIKLANGSSGIGYGVIVNASWAPSPTSWATTESNYGVFDLTCDANKANVAVFRYGIAFLAVSKVTVERVNVVNTKTASGININNGYDVAVRFCRSSGCDGDGIYVYDCVRYDVSHNDIPDAGDFCIELGAGLDYGHTGGTPGAQDGVCIGNKVANAVNYGIGVRGFIDASANPNNHFVDGLVVNGNTMRDCGGGEYVQYENVRNITYGANSVYHGGVLVPATKRYTADLNAGADFTSAAAGAVTDITGLTVTFTPATDVTARIYLRVRANSSASGANAIYVSTSPSPLNGQPIASDVEVVGAGNDKGYVVGHEVFLAAKTAYTIKGQFFQGSTGTFTVQHSSQNTELIVVTQPLI